MLCRAQLLQDVLNDTPEARGRLLLDLVNEPDGYSLTWEASPNIQCLLTCFGLHQKARFHLELVAVTPAFTGSGSHLS